MASLAVQQVVPLKLYQDFNNLDIIDDRLGVIRSKSVES